MCLEHLLLLPLLSDDLYGPGDLSSDFAYTVEHNTDELPIGTATI